MHLDKTLQFRPLLLLRWLIGVPSSTRAIRRVELGGLKARRRPLGLGEEEIGAHERISVLTSAIIAISSAWGSWLDTTASSNNESARCNEKGKASRDHHAMITSSRCCCPLLEANLSAATAAFVNSAHGGLPRYASSLDKGVAAAWSFVWTNIGGSGKAGLDKGGRQQSVRH